MIKNNLNKTQILFVVAIFANLFLAGSCFFLWQKIGTTADQINVREQEVATQEVQKNNLYQLETLVKNEIDPAREQIAEYFVDKSNFIDFVEHVEGLADKAQIIIIEKRGIELKKALQLGIDFEGSFNDSMYFVALIESLPINLKIDNMRIEQTSKNDLWRGWVTVALPSLDAGNN